MYNTSKQNSNSLLTTTSTTSTHDTPDLVFYEKSGIYSKDTNNNSEECQDGEKSRLPPCESQKLSY